MKASELRIGNLVFSKEDIDYIKDLKNEGKTQKWIAQHMNTTKSTISEITN